MALANDMTDLLNKLEWRLGLTPLLPHLPKHLNKEAWAKIIKEDSLVTFSRYYPHKFHMVINDDTCHKEKIDGTTWYYIKDGVLNSVKLLGVKDIDWTDYTTNNSSLGAASLGGGYYYPGFACPEQTLESIMGLQMMANMSSLYNRGIVVDFEYPIRFSLKGLGNTNYDLTSFTLILLVEHRDLSTISPTKMETVEALAQADVANLLWKNLRYFDGLETVYVNINLNLAELEQEAQKKEAIVEELKNSYVSTSNDNIPYIITV